MVSCFDNDGKPVRLGDGAQAQHTPGPWVTTPSPDDFGCIDLPACPDAETFERIRLAVEGE